MKLHGNISVRSYLCNCNCHNSTTTTPNSSPYKQQQLRQQQNPENDDETIDFHQYSSSIDSGDACVCINCQRQEQFTSYRRVESFFTNANISTSTKIDKGTLLTEAATRGVGAVAAASGRVEIETPVVHVPSDVAALGALKPKTSPLFERKSLRSNNQSFSLRTESPYYTQHQLTTADIGGGDGDNKINIEVDFDLATEAEATLNMQQQTNRVNTNMDINRNNGYMHNGTIMTSTSEKREHLYKILVIGELGTGKTSFIKRYVHQFFSQNYRATIGVDFALKVLHWDGNTIVRLQLWDIAGQERFGNMTRVYYKEAVGAFIVFDVTRSGTFDCVSKWKEDLDSKVQLPDGSPIPCILLANKCDQEKQGIVTTPEKMDEYVRENGFAGWFETSAKENINIDEAARALVNKILLNDKLISDADLTDADKVNLNSSGDQAATTETKNKCAC